MAKKSDSDLLSPHDVAHELDVPVSWVKEQVEAGTLPYVKVGRRHIFNRQAVRRAVSRMADYDPPELKK